MTRQQLTDHIFTRRSYLCVGLDTDATKLPLPLRNRPGGVVEFNRRIIEATAPFCAAYKINTAFYEAAGRDGWDWMQQTAAAIPNTHFRIADAKRGDIGNTSSQYARAFFETLDFDAVTVAPYMGEDSIRPFLEYEGKWTIVLGLTSNAGARDFEMQKVTVQTDILEEGIHITRSETPYLYEVVLRKCASWGTPEQMMFVVGATRPDEFDTIRKVAPEHFFLVPGVGAQGGSLKDISEKAMTAGCGLLVNASRAVIYASEGEDFAEAAAAVARQYAGEMNDYLSNIEKQNSL